jgi:hypothetical protein
MTGLHFRPVYEMWTLLFSVLTIEKWYSRFSVLPVRFYIATCLDLPKISVGIARGFMLPPPMAIDIGGKM